MTLFRNERSFPKLYGGQIVVHGSPLPYSDRVTHKTVPEPMSV